MFLGTDQLISCVCVGGGGEWKNKTSEQFAAIIGLQSFFFWACAMQIFFIVVFFRKGRGGGVKLGLYVIHHNNNNNFNLINIYSAKTITIEYKKITDLFTV